jgi:hypothetical protein
MSLRVTEPCRVAYQSSVLDLYEGQRIDAGELADYLAATGAPVEQVDESAAAPTPPAASATKAAWVAHAVDKGVDPSVAEAMTKAELIAEHGAKSVDPPPVEAVTKVDPITE